MRGSLQLLLIIMINIITWNVQGAAGNEFRSVAENIIKINNPGIFVIIKPRVSGIKADRVIKRLRQIG